MGIVCGVPGARIDGNDVVRAVSAGAAGTDRPAFGIMLAVPHVETPGETHVIGNRVSGLNGGGIAAESGLGKLQIKQNQVDRCGAGIEVNDTLGVLLVSIENNQISDIDVDPKNSNQTSVSGIAVNGVRAVAIAANSVIRVGLGATSPNLRSAPAVRVQGSDGVRVAGNELSGHRARLGLFSGTAAGIFAVAPLGDVAIDGNRIRRDSASVPADASTWFGIILFGAVAPAVTTDAPVVVGQVTGGARPPRAPGADANAAA